MSPSEPEFLIEHADHVTMEHRAGIGRGRVAGTGEVNGQQLASQPLDEHLRHVAASIVTDVDDQSLLADLRVEPLDELADAIGPHVGEVDVADPAAAQAGHPLTVARDVCEITQVGLGGDRLECESPGAFPLGPRVDGHLHGPISLVAQQPVGIVAAGQVLAVDGQDVVALLHVDADLG